MNVVYLCPYAEKYSALLADGSLATFQSPVFVTCLENTLAQSTGLFLLGQDQSTLESSHMAQQPCESLSQPSDLAV